MSRDIRAKQEEIYQHISAARSRCVALEHALSENQQQLEDEQATDSSYNTLAIILEHINKLDKLGNPGLLWGDNCSQEQAATNKQRIVSILDDHAKQQSSAQKLRTALNDELTRIKSSIDVLLSQNQNLQDELIAEQSEFIIERELTLQPSRLVILPWSDRQEDIFRLRTTMLVMLSIALLAGYLIPMWEIPEPKRIEFIEIPERLARLVVKKTPPPKPVEETKPQEDIKKTDEPEEKLADEKKMTQDARKVAETTGLLAYSQDFADIIDASSDIKLGSQAAINKKTIGQNRSHKGRSLVTSQVQLSRTGSGTSSVKRTEVETDNSLKKVEFSHVESLIKTADDDKPPGKHASEKPVRSDEEIQVVFDRYKDALYRIYNRELRKNPLLKGKLVLQLTIDPDGKVSKCIIDSSDIDASELERKIVARVLKFNFGEKQSTSSLTILYPIDFLPAS